MTSFRLYVTLSFEARQASRNHIGNRSPSLHSLSGALRPIRSLHLPPQGLTLARRSRDLTEICEESLRCERRDPLLLCLGEFCVQRAQELLSALDDRHAVELSSETLPDVPDLLFHRRADRNLAGDSDTIALKDHIDSPAGRKFFLNAHAKSPILPEPLHQLLKVGMLRSAFPWPRGLRRAGRYFPFSALGRSSESVLSASDPSAGSGRDRTSRCP